LPEIRKPQVGTATTVIMSSVYTVYMDTHVRNSLEYLGVGWKLDKT